MKNHKKYLVSAARIQRPIGKSLYDSNYQRIDLVHLKRLMVVKTLANDDIQSMPSSLCCSLNVT